MVDALRIVRRWPRAVSALAIVFVVGSAAGPTARLDESPARTAQADAAQTDAVQEFQRRLQTYVDLRAALAKKLPPLTLTPSGSDLTLRQRSLADALRAARASARPTDLVPLPVAEQIRAIVLADFRRRTAAEERATFSEVPDAPIPAINRPYPAGAALPTVPPLLLQALPRLPDSLQYRFYGRHIVILDGDAEIIVDYIANVLPPH